MVESVENTGDAAKRLSVAALLTRHEKSIRRFLGRRSGPQVLQRTTLNDLFQETAAVAMHKAGLLESGDDASFLAWVDAIARNVVLRSLSERRRKPATVRIKGVLSTGVGVREADLNAASRTPSSVVARREKRLALKDAIAALPEHYQRAITLYKLEGRPLEDVAAHMMRTKGATCRVIARAMEKLRTLLPDE